MAKKSDQDKGYLAIKSKLIESYSKDPQLQIKWQIEALMNFIAITEVSKTKEPYKSTFITELIKKLNKLQLQYIQPDNEPNEQDLITQNRALEKEIVSLKKELEECNNMKADAIKLLNSK